MQLQSPMQSADLLVKMLKDDPSRMAAITSSPDPVKEVESLAVEVVKETAAQEKAFQEAYLSDKKIYRIAIYVLGALAIIAAIGAIALTAFGKTTPESVIALGSASVGALVGLFAKTPTNN